ALDVLRPRAQVRVTGVDLAPGIDDADDGSAAPVGRVITELAQPRAVPERAQIVDAEPAVAAQIFGTLTVHCDDPGDALRLFQTHAAFLDHLGPLVGFRGDELPEVGRTARDQHAAELREASLDLRVGQGGVDLLVELVNDLGRRALRRAHPVKGAGLVT